MSKKTERIVLKSQARAIISKVYDFMKKEACNHYAEKITDARWRAAQAVGVSESTVTRILREKKVHGLKPSTAHTKEARVEQSNKATSSYSNEASTSTVVFTSPMKKRRVTPRKINLDEFDIGIVRRTIQDFHKEYHQYPTLLRLQGILKELIQFDGCKTTLRTLLHKLGYKWRKTETNRKVLTEKHEIQMLRLKYLKQVKSLRNAGRPIIYTDESYIHTNHVQNMSWSKHNSQIGTRKKVAKGGRIIMVHAGSAAGFIPNALLTYRADIKTGDYHDNMNTQNYLRWLKDKLIPNLPKDAVVVLDNAAYHNSASEKIPTSNCKKLEMQTWLSSNNIAFETSFKKLELYDLIKKNKENFRKYKVDELLNDHGFTVLRLPPYHPDLNPIENIWGIAKNYVASRNIIQNYTSIIPILNEAFDKINSDVWAKTCQHVEKIEDGYLKYFDLDFSFIINVCDSSSSESNISEVNDDSD